MAKKRRKKKKQKVKKPLYSEQKKAYQQFRRDIWNGLDLKIVYREVKKFKGKITPWDGFLYIQTPYYVMRLDDLAKRRFMTKLRLDNTITCEYQYLDKWYKLSEPIHDERVDLFKLFKGGEYDVFPLKLYVEVDRIKTEGESFESFFPEKFIVDNKHDLKKVMAREKRQIDLFDVELVSLLHKEESNPNFNYINFVGVDRTVSHWLQTPLMWKSDSEYIYAYDGLNYPFMIFPIVKDLTRPIDVKLWANMFTWSSQKEG